MSMNIIYLFLNNFENDAKLDFPYDFFFLQSLLVDYLKTMNMDLAPFASSIQIMIKNKHEQVHK
jgi:hypothetical protein